MGKYIYMLVTKDKYELPIFIADGPSELARIIGVHPDNITSAISHARRRGSKCQYVRVEIGEDE